MKNIKVIIDFMYSSGVTQVVLSEESRCTSLFENWNIKKIFDRRSAAYYALGVAQESKAPVLLLIEEFNDASLSDALPGITEAFYQNVPLLVLGLDRNGSWLMDESDVIGDKCVFDCSISVGSIGFQEKDIATINYAISALTENGGGPVFMRYKEVETPSTASILPHINIISETVFFKELAVIKDYIKEKSVYIVLDSTEKYSTDDVMLLASFCNKYDGYISQHDVYYVSRYLPSRDTKDSDIIIELGVNHLVSNTNAFTKHWVVSPELRTDTVSDCHIRMHWRKFIELMVDGERICIKERVLNQDLNSDWSVANIVSTIITFFRQSLWVSGFSINGVSIVDSLRSSSTANSASFVDCSGGEGNLSMFVGQAIAAKDDICLCFIDQKNFFRDMNALHIQAIGCNARIVLFASGDEGRKAVAWSRSCGFDAVEVYNMDGLKNDLVDFVAPDRVKPALITVVI